MTARETLHEWPLSCVQRLHCEDGKTFIYKVQSEPLVEAQFYRQARSSLLVTAQILPEDIHAALRGKTGYVHGDLLAEIVLLTANGYRVLNWQRPLWGPVALERLSLLSSLGVDPNGHMAAGAQRLHVLLQIGWLAPCAIRWFPPGVHHYDEQIAQLIGSLNPPN